jgi:hypothetical protein
MALTPQSQSKKTRTRGSKRKSVIPPLDPLGTGMPALDSIIGVDEFKKGSKMLRIIHTNEIDEYEQLPPKTKPKKHRGARVRRAK